MSEATAAEERARPLPFGVSFEAGNGLRLAVLGMRVLMDPDDEPGAHSRHVVIDARISNPGEEAAAFENDFGVIDPAGTAYRYRWMNRARYPDVLPGIATLEPGAAIEGEAHILLPEEARAPLAMLRASVLKPASLAGCSSCDQEVRLIAEVLWHDGVEDASTRAPDASA